MAKLSRKKKIWLIVLTVIVAIVAYLYFFAFAKNDVKVLVFSKTEAYRHESIETGIEAIKKLGLANNFIVENTEDATKITESYLKDFQAVIFLNTTGDILDAIQQSELERFIQAGGGFVGVHAASDTEYGWPWYGKLVGAYFDSHPMNPNVQDADLHVVNPNHNATDSLPKVWKTTDEWYNFKSINDDINVLITIDEETYNGGNNGKDHPISWYKEYDGGRAFYTGLGHTKEQFFNPDFLNHLRGGIQYAIGPGSLVDYSKAYSEVMPEENRFTKVVFMQNLNEPMELDFIDKNKVVFIERGGAMHIYNLESGTSKLAGKVDVWKELEDGLLGMALDPNFKDNNWVYLYYSENKGKNFQNLSRFELKNDSLYLDTEKVLLQIETQREECCHSAGSIEFGPDGFLYLSTGDNTNPHDSNGFAPIDERDGRASWDAQKSASNPNDLRGKIIRIKPEDDGTYSIPEGNLFAQGEEGTRPEIYVMGNRNPYRISVDSRRNFLFWGEVGPDANNDSLDMGIRGYDEVNMAKKAGNFGWPYFIANNKIYNDFDFESNTPGKAFNLKQPLNESPNNTGRKELPAPEPAMIYYPYADSEEFPLVGSGGRNAMAGPVYYSNDYTDSGRNWPEYFDGKLLIYDFMRSWFFAVTFDEQGNYEKMSRILPNAKFNGLIDVAFGPDGALYYLEYGSGWFSQNPDATLSRIEFTKGNRNPIAKIDADKTIGAHPMTVNLFGRNSIDYDGDKLTYLWSFGDGSENSTEVNPVHTYEESGQYKVTLEVKDAEGRTSKTETEILVGNELPELSWEINSGNSQYYWPNQPLNISYKVSVSDAEDGSLEAGTLDKSKVIVSFDYMSQGSDMVMAAKDHAQMAAEANSSIGKTLIEGSDCMACHKETGKSIGPAYLEVAKRYKNDLAGQEKLASKIIEGGAGNWGETPMSAHPSISTSEAKQIVDYIMSLNGGGSKAKKSKYPVNGNFQGKEHLNKKTLGTYVLTASYTDQGGGKIGPLTAKQTIFIKSPKIEAETFDEGQAMIFTAKAGDVPGVDEDITIAIGAKDKSIVFKDIDLSGVRAIKGKIATVTGITEEGTVEFRLGSAQGDLIGSVEIKKAGLTKLFNVEEYNIDLIKTVSGKHDLFICFKAKDGKLPKDTIIAILDWIELMN